MASTWHPTALDESHIVRVVDEDGNVLWTGLVTYEPMPDSPDRAAATGNDMHALLVGMPLPFGPPGIEHATNADAFGHWWRQLCYVFELPDPRSVPPLPGGLVTSDKVLAERFIATTRVLAASGLVSSDIEISFRQETQGGNVSSFVDFPALDLQAGFAVALRQCDDPGEHASYAKVKNAIALACHMASDVEAAPRAAAVDTWAKAVKALHRRSAEQLVRDRFVEVEGWLGWQFDEPDLPRRLIETFSYGDLIHWDPKKNVKVGTLAFSADWQRFRFFMAAIGLAHIYIGFADLVKVTIGL